MANNLIKATSPYLLQHAHNPVDWYEWGEEALRLAKDFDRPILVSIGYSACHWCHVMERESFENDEIASIMNDLFVCIKIDREERPDLDAIYMAAVQAMGLNGGWPLNVFLTSDAKPFYGGTYFPQKKWAHILYEVSNAFRKHRSEVNGTAENLVQHLSKSDFEKYKLSSEVIFEKSLLTASVQGIKDSFDKVDGGIGTAPKFPMPCIYDFFLRFLHFNQDEQVEKQLFLTLDKMAAGGIYDQIGGGFARYSVDEIWLAPHFEKMLYDNAQLIQLYAEAFAVSGNTKYKEVVLQSINFLKSAMMSPEGGFYAALDADSEGVEGKFYVWSKAEFEKVIGEANVDLALDYFSVTESGNFEGENILTSHFTDQDFCKKHQISHDIFVELKKEWISRLHHARESRIKPGLDDKILAGWNGLTLTALCKSYRYLHEPSILDLALLNANFLSDKMLKENHLFRTYKNGEAKITGFLEDYAAVIEGFIALYEVSFQEKWLLKAEELMQFCLTSFFDEKENLFYFTSNLAEKLIARQKEIFDNVIPSSNAIMAENLLRLGHFFEKMDWIEISAKMTSAMSKIIKVELRYTARWASVYLLHCEKIVEAALTGTRVEEWASTLQNLYLPSVIFATSTQKSDLVLLKNRFLGENFAFFCKNFACSAPSENLADAKNDLLNLVKA